MSANATYETRKDGWPLCPRCGEDELWSPLIPDPLDSHPPIAAYIAAGLRCYKCGWDSDPLAVRSGVASKLFVQEAP